MDLPFRFPYCAESKFFSMSDIINSEIRVSEILSQFNRPLIFLRSLIDEVGYALGMGVAISSFQMSG